MNITVGASSWNTMIVRPEEETLSKALDACGADPEHGAGGSCDDLADAEEALAGSDDRMHLRLECTTPMLE